MSPKISIILPVYNAERNLGQCLDSILLQTLPDIEVICVDDGSKDASLSTLQTYAMFDERVKVIHQEHAGVGAARNRGLAEATGEFIISLDADDFFEAEMLEKMLQKAETEHSDVVICCYTVFDDSLKEKKPELALKIDKKLIQKAPCKPEDFGDKLLSFCNMAAWNKLVRTDLIKKNNLKFAEDTRYAEYSLFTCFALMLANKISIVDEPLACIRLNFFMIPLSYYKNECFPEVLNLANQLWKQLNLLKLQQYESIFVSYIKTLLCDTLIACPPEKRRENLVLIRKTLSSDLFQQLFPALVPRVSIIIPAYNAAEFLPECLDSCINQTLEDIQIICVDDGSTDNTWDVLTKYAQKDKRIIILQQENSRQAIARNKAMTKARGQYLQFLDADDYLDADTCECFYLYSSLFDLHMCQHFPANFFDGTREKLRRPPLPLWFTDQFPVVFNYQTNPELLTHMCEAACLTFYNRGFVTRNKISWINKKLAYEDTPFFTQAVQKAKNVGTLHACFYHRRVHPGATTQQMSTNLKDFVEVVKYTLDYLQKNSTPQITKSYCRLFAEKAKNGFNPLDTPDKDKMAPYLYEIARYIQAKYHVPLSTKAYNWCLQYLKNRSRKERLLFRLHALVTKCIRNEYHLNLFSWQRNPTFKIAIFGLPILYLKRKIQTQTEQDTKDDIVRSIARLKLCGLTLVKIQETTHV